MYVSCSRRSTCVHVFYETAILYYNIEPTYRVVRLKRGLILSKFTILDSLLIAVTC